jgi:chromosome segregation protein
MRLERLEINGFKSFSDRAELAFDQGVTAIVGPNGCGKSNVADAITWVLGEQSAKSLRGDRMEDVIFGGSDARKPGGTAEVRLRLTGLPIVPRGVEPAALAEFPTQNGNGNGDGHANGHGPHPDEPVSRDVEVTRRLYRSGESEYLIDGEVCRLRDVHELLMDTGLGAKAYAIIEQGKIGMILSSRPADRRHLIEEAAGITKYKSRRRTAELKLEAAQQNLTRVDDIVFEVEKQRGALKRQAAKARRYRRLREELRRWEKVVLARRYRELGRTIEVTRAQLAETREREAAAAARVAEGEADLARLRIEQAEADSRSASVREHTHARELDLSRRQQQQEFNRHQVEALGARAAEITLELEDLLARQEPARLAVSARADLAEEAGRARDSAVVMLAEATEAYARALQQVEGLEADVETARGSVFAALNDVSALRHVIDHATLQRGRVGETLGKLEVEHDDHRRENETVTASRASATESLARARATLDQVRLAAAARESELAAARTEHDSRSQRVRAHEQALARVEARLSSLVEIEASRGEFGDAARMVLVEANGRVNQRGAVADYLDVDRRYERAVEACLGDLLQHVVVERHDQAAAGLALVREQDAGRCGFVVIDPGSNGYHPREVLRMPGIVPISDVLRVAGPHVATIQKVMPEAYVAETFEQAAMMSRQTTAPVATIEGDLFRGPHLVSGGAKAESRGILATKREIKELRDRLSADRDTFAVMTDQMNRLEIEMAQATSALAALTAERHRQEMAIVSLEAQVERATEEAVRLTRKAEVIALERRQAEEEQSALDARHSEAESSLGRLLEEQRAADERLGEAQRRLAIGREEVSAVSARAGDARAAHAALVERTSALEAEVARLQEAAQDIEHRIAARTGERDHVHRRRAALQQAIVDEALTLDQDAQALDALRVDVRAADDAATTARTRVEAQDAAIHEVRRSLDEVRGHLGALGVACATAESDLGHLARMCIETTQVSLDEVLVDVEAMERAGEATPDAAAIAADEPDPEDAELVQGGDAAPPASDEAPQLRAMTSEDAIETLKAKIDRLGPVNMMAIEQFDELEDRHGFLISQRKDLVDSIAQTSEAITRIDETSKRRFNEAFSAIQQNFQMTFSVLFGGGRAGLSLLDEDDPLESGIDIVASPPGKRLQSVQLLSGGEKALTAIALMFAIFRYKPSPFCLLDEIDAPLDDANVGRFVDMLRGMLDRTQFILITHNRRTMEIANRLYGVTMEEPGVSKLISVQLN